jgi:hypothetical protein
VFLSINSIEFNKRFNNKIPQTFEIENTPFGVQPEFYRFEQITDDSRKLNICVIYESVDQKTKPKTRMPESKKITHNRIQNIASKLK